MDQQEGAYPIENCLLTNRSEEPGKRQIQKEAEYVNKIAARQSGQKAETQNQGTDKDQDISQG